MVIAYDPPKPPYPANDSPPSVVDMVTPMNDIAATDRADARIGEMAEDPANPVRPRSRVIVGDRNQRCLKECETAVEGLYLPRPINDGDTYGKSVRERMCHGLRFTIIASRYDDDLSRGRGLSD
jgi:hypothetical protein